MEKINVWRLEEAITPENETDEPLMEEYDAKQEQHEEEHQLEEDEQTAGEEEEWLLKPEEGDNIGGQEGSIATLWPDTVGEAVEEGDIYGVATAMLVDIDCCAPKVVDEPTIWMDEDDEDEEDVVWQVCCLLYILTVFN